MSIRISQSAARSIVHEIGQVIDANINLMDDTGHIIASMDESRIGMLHMGARKIIEEGLSEYLVTRAMATQSTREGINLPIRVMGDVAGVIGITGPPAEVKGYGRIVQSMSQILLEERFTEMDIRLERHIRYRFIEEWIGQGQSAQTEKFRARGRRLGIDITQLRRTAAIRIARLSLLNETLEGQRKIDQIDDDIRLFMERHEEALYLYLPSRYICLFPAESDEGMERICQSIAAMIRRKYGEALYFGIDSLEEGSVNAALMNEQAVRALKAAEETDSPIMFYHQLNLEMTLYDVSEENMRRYLAILFAKVPDQERSAAMELANCFFQSEGSIQAMAGRLYLHPNTVQYRLKKLAEETGYDLRKPSQAAFFAIAQVFSRILDKKHGPI